MRKVGIKTATNGYIVNMYGETTVFQEGNEIELLYYIKSNLVMDGGKWSEKDIFITEAHGHKYECTKKDCILCKRYDAIMTDEDEDD